MDIIAQVISPSLMLDMPALLVVGSHENSVAYVQRELQRILCPHHGCGACISCRQIAEQQHHSVMWLAPEKTYTIAQFDPIFETLALSLEPNQSFFFVIQYADFLPAACANRLLKSLEEPPRGYHFVLLAQRPEKIISTITSRCVMHVLERGLNTDLEKELVIWFTVGRLPAPTTFLKHLEQEQISEQETHHLVDAILLYWTRAYAQSIERNDTKLRERAQAIIDVLRTAYSLLPMPGSSKLFWKDLFLQFIAH